MSISATRKVSSSTSSPRAERAYTATQHSQFVENIDTRNNVLVRDDSDDNSHRQQFAQDRNHKDENADISPSVAYVQNSIEALAVSGVFNDSENEQTATGHKVSVYDNNQSIIRDEEAERTGRNYLKHFYEKNEHLIDVDKLI